jgi:hypothetical protein
MTIPNRERSNKFRALLCYACVITVRSLHSLLPLLSYLRKCIYIHIIKSRAYSSSSSSEERQRNAFKEKHRAAAAAREEEASEWMEKKLLEIFIAVIM